MFAGGLREMQQNEIPIHGISYTAMEKILDYIYTSEIELDLENVQEILMAASLFQVCWVQLVSNCFLLFCFAKMFVCFFVVVFLQLENVISFCCDFLFSWLDDSNILEVLHLADVYGLEHLKAKVHSYILRNIQSLSRTDVYRQLPEEDVFRVLSSDALQVASENEVYEAALHYHYSPEEVETDQVYLQVSRKVCVL